MKFTVAVLVLAGIALPAFASNWMRLGTNGDGTLSGDTSSFKMENGLVSAWFKVDYNTMRPAKVNGVEKQFNQEKVLYQANCAVGLGVIREIVQYNTHGWKLIQSMDNKSGAMEHPVPDSRADNLYKLVCASQHAAAQRVGHRQAD